jgi:Bacterial protein of unknown function (DUF916)
MRPARFLTLLTYVTCAISAALLLALAGPSVSSTHAASAGGVASFSLQLVKSKGLAATNQSYFVFDAAQGATVQGEVRVTNNGSATGSVQLYPVDATTGQSGGIVYRNGEDPRNDVGAWLFLSASTLTLSPHQSQIVSFTSTIPDDAYAGTHLGAIVAANLTQQTASGPSAVHITIQHLAVIAVQIEVAGASVERVEVTSIKQQASDPNAVELGVENTGTVLVKPTVRLQLLDDSNQVVRDVSFKMGQMLPQAKVGVPVVLGGDPLDAGVYQAVVTLTYGQDLQQSVSRLKLTVGPAPITLPVPQIKLAAPDLQPMPVALTGVLVLAATLAIVLLVRRARRRQTSQRARYSFSQPSSRFTP